jgi:head-tail adaptor
MEAGKLRHIVSIQEASTHREGMDVIQDHTTVADRHCDIMQLMGREVERAKQIHADAEYQIRMRFFEGLTTKHRLLFGSRTFEILNINNVMERNIEHILLCKESL